MRWFMTKFNKYRKAVAAGVGAFVSVPAVQAVFTSDVDVDWKTLVGAIFTGVLVAFSPANKKV